VGWELQRALQPLGQVIALDRTQNKDGLSGDLANFEAIIKLLILLIPMW
jgi:dTDP-4-dehydrorhamnose reductase